VFGVDRSESNPQHPPGEKLRLPGWEQGGPGTGEVGNAQLSPPAISQPKGGRAIRRMGEKFSPIPGTGTALSVPIYTTFGRSCFRSRMPD
jgi:hypothetical protein